MRGMLFAGFISVCAGPAFASGGLDCTADDARVTFSVHGGVTRGMGGPLFQFNGELEIKDKTLAEDLRKLGFDLPHVAQYWFDGDDLRLDLYREREGDKPFGSVELVIKTKSVGDEGSFEGTYEVSVFDGVADGAEPIETKHAGKVGCFTE